MKKIEKNEKKQENFENSKTQEENFKNQENIKKTEYFEEDEKNQENINMRDDLMGKGEKTFEILKTRLPLHYYDLEPDKSPEEWLLYCELLKKEDFHGFSPIFLGNKYEWKKVKVVEFLKNDQKYVVEFIENNVKKSVSRLALRFKCEDMKKFERRNEIARKLRQEAEEEMRFEEYVRKMPEEFVRNLEEKVF